MPAAADWIIDAASHPNAATQAALAHLKVLLKQTWAPSFESKGVTATTTTAVPGLESPVPITRGEIDLPESVDMFDIFSVIMTASLRPSWDERTESAEVREHEADKNAIAYSVQLSFARDLCVSISPVMYDAELDAHLVVQRSVEHKDIPDVSGKVRAEVRLAAIMVTKNASGGHRLTYIVDVDTKGSIPSAILKIVSSSTPMCAGKMIEYVQTHGAPARFVSGKTTLITNNSFDRATGRATFEMKGEPIHAYSPIDAKIFPTGAAIQVTGGEVTVTKEGRGVVIKSSGPATVSVVITKHSGAAGDIVVNGVAI
ncbi:hypothetical protein HK105_202591 [Polyrhizophydium stewartii]|uniref:START domain-containing protein n=1 Tax=Polyrhizophydium stewartii TaxID=2732419 RepID=A0ABR4NDX8_9FUNG